MEEDKGPTADSRRGGNELVKEEKYVFLEFCP
jgi:hypothetical protein